MRFTQPPSSIVPRLPPPPRRKRPTAHATPAGVRCGLRAGRRCSIARPERLFSFLPSLLAGKLPPCSAAKRAKARGSSSSLFPALLPPEGQHCRDSALPHRGKASGGSSAGEQLPPLEGLHLPRRNDGGSFLFLWRSFVLASEQRLTPFPCNGAGGNSSHRTGIRRNLGILFGKERAAVFLRTLFALRRRPSYSRGGTGIGPPCCRGQ